MTYHLLTRILVVTLVGSLLLLCAPKSYISAHTTNTVTVNVDTLNVRQGPGLKYEVITQVNKGESFRLLQTKKDWVEIQLSSSQQGWVADWLVDHSSHISQIRIQSKVDALNVRSGPSTQFPVIQRINRSEEFDLVQREGDWVQIKLARDLTGWVAGWFTETVQTEQPTQASSVNQVRITASVLNVRSGPDVGTRRLGKLQKGDIVAVLDLQNKWYKIDYNGEQGWVAGWHAEKVDQPVSKEVASSEQGTQTGPQVIILNPGTNLRSGPGLDFKVVARGQEGDQFEVLSTEGKWYQIKLPSGESAYVAGWIVAAKGISPIATPQVNSYLKGKTIVIDPGHGGIDDGATGSHFKTLEKNLNMKVSFLLKKKLEAAGATVIMTRETDIKIPLETRVYLSHRHNADMFISVHHNTHENSRISGMISYYYEGTRDRELANILQRELVKSTGLRDMKARKGDFFVLRENAQLAVLLELGFLTNYQDEFKARTSKFQEQAAEGIFQGILLYCKKNPADR